MDNGPSPMTLAPSPAFLDTSPVSSISSLPPSPSFAEFQETAATLDGLAKQLGESAYEDDTDVRCCCGRPAGADEACAIWKAKDKVEDRLKLSGEVGNALLARCEALEKRCQRQVEKYEIQLQVKRAALADSVKRVHNLDRANTTHMQRYAEMTKKNEALDKRYTQALHTQTLTQASLTHVRGELSDLRNRIKRQSVALASGAGIEERLEEVEQRYEEAKVSAEFESRRLKDEMRRKTRLEARIEELEAQLALRTREVEEAKAGRSKDAQDLLANAKQRLDELHSELSETFHARDPSETPEYQRVLNDLVASNTLLKHDTTELVRQLLDSNEENKMLREEIDELRSAVGVARRSSPEPTSRVAHLASELRHARTGSTPVVPDLSRSAWARRSVQIPPSSRILLEHGRNSSIASFMTSSSIAADISGLGMGSVGEKGGSIDRSVGTLSPNADNGRQSPNLVLRSSPSGGIGYVVHGVPKGKANPTRPPINRSMSMDRRRLSLRNFSPKGVDVIAEWGPVDGESATHRPNMSVSTSISTDEPISPGSEYFRAADMARRRRSMLSRSDSNSPKQSSPNISQTLVDQSVTADLPSPMSEGSLHTPGQKRVQRRTLLLLTRNRGVQTDPPEEHGTVNLDHTVKLPSQSVMSSPGRRDKDSETSSIQDVRSTAGVMALLIDYLAKTLSKIKSTDITTLNRRLKKQHLPGDVQHLSRTTLQALQLELMDLRHAFRGVYDLPNVTRREFSSLLKLMKDVFIEMTELQSLVNDVTVDYHVAKRLHRAAYAVEGEEKDPKASGLGWIAPITKLFVTAPEDAVDTTKSQLDTRRLAPAQRPGMGTMKAPKLQASTGSTTTHVSVEFGGAGIVRRSTPAPAQTANTTATSSSAQEAAVRDSLPGSLCPTSGSNVTVGPRDGKHLSNMPHGDVSGTLQGSGTLRPSKSRANRNELLGIFAGAARPISPTPWVVLPNELGSGARTVRASSSRQYKGSSTRDDIVPSRKLPAAVDAVIDSTVDQMDPTDRPADPPLLEKTLRRRGLSDSSIRSTFVSQSVDIRDDLAEASMPMPRASVAQGIIPSRGGYEKKGYFDWTSRLYSFRPSSTEQVPVASTSVPDEAATTDGPSHETMSTSESVQTTSTIPSLSTLVDPIPVRPSSPSQVKAAAVGSQEMPSSLSKPPGLLGYLANSLTAGAASLSEGVEAEGSDEYRDARHQSGAARVGMHVTSRRGNWT